MKENKDPLFDLPKVVRSLRNGRTYTWDFSKQVYVSFENQASYTCGAAYVMMHPTEFEKVEPEPPAWADVTVEQWETDPPEVVRPYPGMGMTAFIFVRTGERGNWTRFPELGGEAEHIAYAKKVGRIAALYRLDDNILQLVWRRGDCVKNVAYSEAEALAKILADPWLEARFEAGRCRGKAVAFLASYESREKQQIAAFERVKERIRQRRLAVLTAPFGTRFTDDGRPDESPAKLPDSYERSARVGRW